MRKIDTPDKWPGGFLRILFTSLSAMMLTASQYADHWLYKGSLNFIALGFLALGVFRLVNYSESYERHFGEGDILEKD